MADAGWVERKLRAESQFRVGANWFFWIAALSLVNSGIQLFGMDWGFVAGLGVTQLFDAAGREFGPAARLVAVALDVVAAVVFVGFGILCRSRHAWGFVVGMVFYAVDGLVFLLAQDWLGLGFHVFVLICLWSGLAGLRKLQTIEAEAGKLAPSS